MSVENYFNQLMESGYTVLTEPTIIWPKDFTEANKRSLLQKALEYFQMQERYKECAVLVKKIDNLTKVKKGKTKSSQVEKTS
jgi:hypothetical protein